MGQRANDNRARAYQTVREGRLVWVYPGETPPGAAPKVRSRLETDDEVRARITVARPWWGSSQVAYSGQKLDNMLKNIGLPPRKVIDEPA